MDTRVPGPGFGGATFCCNFVGGPILTRTSSPGANRRLIRRHGALRRHPIWGHDCGPPPVHPRQKLRAGEKFGGRTRFFLVQKWVPFLTPRGAAAPDFFELFCWIFVCAMPVGPRLPLLLGIHFVNIFVRNRFKKEHRKGAPKRGTTLNPKMCSRLAPKAGTPGFGSGHWPRVRVPKTVPKMYPVFG